LSHPATIPYPILKFEPSGINNSVKAVSLNAKFPRDVNAAPFASHTIDLRLEHFSKALSPIFEIFDGSVIDSNDEQP
jgi:hypothetical protein